MKIIYYTNQISRPGGLERVLVRKVNAWIGKGYQVEVLTYNQKGNESFYELHGGAIRSGLNIPYNSKKSTYSLANLFLLPLHLVRLTVHLRKSKPDVVLVANSGLEFYFFPFLPTRAIRIKEEHLSGFLPKKERSELSFSQKSENWLRYKVLSFYDRYVVLNNNEKKFGPAKNTEAIPNPIDIRKVDGVVQKDREKLIISAGRFSSVKQFDKLIDIFKGVSASHPDWNLKIFGDGGKRKYLEKKVVKYRLQDRVLLPGNTENIYDEMQKASIFALTSKTEGFPMVLLEALVNGLSVISFDSPYGPRNILKDREDGLLVPLNDEKEYKRLLIKLMDNPDLRVEMAEKGRENVRRFSVEEVMTKWDKLFTDLGLHATEA